MILLIDNFDSFVYNLARYVSELGFENSVRRNTISIQEIFAINPTHIIISPGPGTPDQAGNSLEIIREFSSRIPILGVCLGHQAIAQVYGGKIIRAKQPMHGKSSSIFHEGKKIFHGLKKIFTAGRYHSLIVSEDNFPEDLEITARCHLGEIMGISHRKFPVHGVQFHPESILTETGYDLLRNFLCFDYFASKATMKAKRKMF